jgi:hypothetical protein
MNLFQFQSSHRLAAHKAHISMHCAYTSLQRTPRVNPHAPGGRIFKANFILIHQGVRPHQTGALMHPPVALEGGGGTVFLNEMVQPPPTAWAGVGNVLRHASRSLRSSEINYRSTEARDWVDPLMAIMCPWANVGEGVENAPRFTHFGPENRQPPPAQNSRNESGDQASSSTNLQVRNHPAISPYKVPPSNDGNLRDRSSSSPPAPPMPSLG